MSKKPYKSIVIDGLILLLVSTIFVSIIDFCFKQIPGANNESNPIVSAIIQEKDHVIQELLTQKPQYINQQDEHGDTPIMKACYVNFYNYADVVKMDDKRLPYINLLLEKGADLHAVDKDGWNALCWASWSGLVQISETLANKSKGGAFVNAPDKQGNTPLSIAALRGNPEIIKMLLAHGANRNATAKNGFRPIDFAKQELERYSATFSPDSELDKKEVEEKNMKNGDYTDYYNLRNHIFRLQKSVQLLSEA